MTSRSSSRVPYPPEGQKVLERERKGEVERERPTGECYEGVSLASHLGLSLMHTSHDFQLSNRLPSNLERFTRHYYEEEEEYYRRGKIPPSVANSEA